MKKWGMIAAIITAILVLAAGILVAVKKQGSRTEINLGSSSMKDLDDDRHKDDDEEDFDDDESGDFATTATETKEEYTYSDKVSKLTAMKDSIVCIDINGKVLKYKSGENEYGYTYWGTEDIDATGVLFSEIADVNGEPVLYQYMIVPSTNDAESSLVLRANLIGDDGTDTAVVEILENYAFGMNSGDTYRYTLYRKDNMIIFAGYNAVFVNADGESYWVQAYEFDGTAFKSVLNEGVSGSTIGMEDEWDDTFREIATKFDAVGLSASAQMMRESYDGVMISPNENVDKLFTVTGRNNYLTEELDWDPSKYTITLSFTNGWQSEYIFEDSNSRYLTNSDLYGLSSEELRYARNEIYARHGRRFKDEQLQSYFNSKSWYQGYRDEIPDSELNAVEIANRDLISSFE